ncbi:MAG: glycosyltransferase family 4 protein [Chloroflexi bacterium]|jgi:glycosyltransferase involved in cell wall biosynthesis|nr:glycosyltransferase family 4 protein [Chloroflexota bacterium]
MPIPSPARHIGFVSTRFAGTDGVSLEAGKWASVLEELGHEVYYFAGECDRPPERTRLVAEAFYRHPAVDDINRVAYAADWGTAEQARAAHPEIRALREDFFSIYVRPPRISRLVDELRAHLVGELYAFARDFELDLLVVENALAIPLNLPLGLALAQFVAETGFPVIAHHHDFHWERQRFLVNCVPDYIAAAFPPVHQSIRHVVINSVQAAQLAGRHALNSRVVPNVMDFEREPDPPDGYAAGVRADLGVGPGELLFLQPTRVIQRKGIEHAIELTRRLGRPARLVISHAAGDEGLEYAERVREFADLLGVDVRFESELVADRRATTPDGRRVYALADVYPASDLVTYPSSIEGFGNAFLEAVYHRRPIVVNNYSTYEVDIKPRGFRVIWFDGFISEATLRQARRILDHPAEADAWAEQNYALARRHFSFAVLRRHLADLIADCFGERV